jgi:anti-sigma B factor antagonist
VSLSIETRGLGSRGLLIALRGELDYESALELRAAISRVLEQDSVRHLVVSLAGVTFIDSTGIGTLVVAHRICSDVGVTLRVRDANPFIGRLFTVLGVANALGLPEVAEPRLLPGQRPQPKAQPRASQPV